jgi:hypothetical protein
MASSAWRQRGKITSRQRGGWRVAAKHRRISNSAAHSAASHQKRSSASAAKRGGASANGAASSRYGAASGQQAWRIGNGVITAGIMAAAAASLAAKGAGRIGGAWRQ